MASSSLDVQRAVGLLLSLNLIHSDQLCSTVQNTIYDAQQYSSYATIVWNDYCSDYDIVRQSQRILQEQQQNIHNTTIDGVVVEDYREESVDFVTNVIGTVVCVLFVAISAGLFLGYMTLDTMDLQIIQRASLSEDDRAYAANLYPIIKKRHRLLVTLLIFSTISYETLPIFMDALVPSVYAVVFSTLLIMVFGEIIPSSLFTGPHQLYLSNFMAPFVRFLMWFFYPVVYPLESLLDFINSIFDSNAEKDDVEDYNRGELAALVRIQYERRNVKAFRGRKSNITKRSNLNNTNNNSAKAGHAHGTNNSNYTYTSHYSLTSPTSSSSRSSWKALKKEILQAVQERELDSNNQSSEEDKSLSLTDNVSYGYRHSNSIYYKTNNATGSNGNGSISGWNGKLGSFRKNRSGNSSFSGTPSYGNSSSFYSNVVESSTPDIESEMTPPMHISEVKMVEGSLQMRTRIAMDVYTPLTKLYAVSENMILNRENIVGIYREGFSRVPVYRPGPSSADSSVNDDEPDSHDSFDACDQILGFLMTRQLMMIDWDDERPVSTLPLVRPDCVSPRTTLVQVLKLLRTNGSLMAFVCARPDLAEQALEEEEAIPIDAGFLGVITLQDVVEAILQDPIYDEADYRKRERAVATLQRWAATKLQSMVRKLRARRQLMAIKEASSKQLEEDEQPPSRNTTPNDTTPLLGFDYMSTGYTTSSDMV